MNTISSNAISNKSNGAALDGYEERIKGLYSSLTLAQLKATIDGESRQKIPESQYRKKLRQLGLRKYRKASEINGLSSILARKPKETKVFLKGKRLPQSEVERMIARSRPDIFTQLNSQLPIGYVIRSPTSDPIENYAADIPFLQFERALHILFQNPRYRYLLGDKGISPQLLQDLGATPAGRPESMLEAWNLIPLSLDNTRLLGDTFFTNNPRALARLRELIPFSSIHHQVSGNPPSRQDANLVNISLRRQLFFSISNCFAGIDGFPTWQPFNILEGVSPEIIFQLFRLTKGPTARSIAQSLFKASIESDSHAMIHALLSIEAAGIDVNKEKIFINNIVYTPVERASSLRHDKTIRVLVQHGADVSMTHESFIYDTNKGGGALERAVTAVPYRPLDRETFQLLSNATCAITSCTIQTLIDQKEEDYVLYLIEEQFEKCEWAHRFGTLAPILNVLSEESAIQVTTPALIEHGGHWLLKLAIKKGYLSLFEKLISDYGVRPDIHDLYEALCYYNMSFVRRLLPLADPSVHMGNREDLDGTPLSLAITSGDKDLINLMRDVGAFTYLHSWPAFEPAWKAAVKERDKEIIKELRQLHQNLPRECLGDLLTIASREGDYQAAKELIDSGATVFSTSFSDAASSKIVELLLDAGPSRNAINGALSGAIRIADYSLIRRLLVEGAELPNRALELALKQSDEKLVDILLQAGARGLNKSSSSMERGALLVTAELGDDHLTQHVLRRGADPNDPEALETAFYTDRTVFHTILAAHKRRYGFRTKDFGSSVLFFAVQNKDTTLIEKLLQHNADPHGFIRTERTEGPYQRVTPFGYAIATNNSNDFAMMTQFLSHQCYASDVVSYLDVGFEDWMQARDIRLPATRTTAFLAAIATENIELVRLLAQSDETIVRAPARWSIRRTALQRAAEIGSFKMVELIHNLGADINEPPNRIGGATALQLAAIGGFGQIVCYLIQHGADINARGAVIDGMTALVGAAAHGRIDIVALLLNKGAGRGENSSEQFESAMKEAEYYGHYPICDYLKERWEAQQKDAPQGPDPVDEFLMNLSDGD
ncbi:hypothetical protein E0Z10_g9098 [Xylaria hypoxylon]|uniref:Clr5 domain-containing protein n=1 Tax=Xylaria hypoxylon TaxID=37992 RepID=A0A4Z0YKA6_9PEZI|nr:hypothetical protein E0Z10_g9098 [Xylaria hypoxylon]